MRTVSWKLALLVGGLAVSATAWAQPKAEEATTIPAGWAKIETTAFKMALPGDWSEFRQVFFDLAKDPVLGAWYYSSKNALAKIFVRVRPMMPGSMKDAIQRSHGELARKITDLREIAPSVLLPPDENKREMAILFLKGNTTAKSTKTGKLGEQPHFVVRVIQHQPDLGLRVMMTYLFASESTKDPQAFVEQHLGTFSMQNPKEIRKLVKVEGLKPVKRPPPPAKKPPVKR
jgi:hypothetical protein